MDFALGFIAGVASCVFIAVVLVLLRRPITQAVDPIIQRIENAGPRARGFVVEPEDESEIVRREHIKRNAEQGRDTPISELL